jgi:hypothetical protein
VCRRPPIASTASQNAPAPSPSSTRCAQEVERRRGLGEDRRQPQRQVDHVRQQSDVVDPPCGVREQPPRIEEATLVGVVLDADEIEPRPVGGDDGLHRCARFGRVRDDEGAQLHPTARTRADGAGTLARASSGGYVLVLTCCLLAVFSPESNRAAAPACPSPLCASAFEQGSPCTSGQARRGTIRLARLSGREPARRVSGRRRPGAQRQSAPSVHGTRAAYVRRPAAARSTPVRSTCTPGASRHGGCRAPTTLAAAGARPM